MKRVLITGASSGMGYSTTKLFLERGWQVLMVDLNQPKEKSAQEELQEAAKKGQSKVFFKSCDITNEADMQELYEYGQEHLQGIDTVVNNAGIFAPGMLHETSVDTWEKIFSVDVKAILLTGKYFIPDMIKNGGGTIVNTASVSGLQGDYNMAAYNAAKGAVVNLCRSMALDYGKYNIRVNNVCPSACATPMFLRNPQEVIDQFNEANPLKRICTPEEVAKAIYFLASEESSSCNGVNLPVSGGIEIYSGQPVQ